MAWVTSEVFEEQVFQEKQEKDEKKKAEVRRLKGFERFMCDREPYI